MTLFNRRAFLTTAAAAIAQTACDPPPAPELEELSLAELSKWPSAMLTESYLGRIGLIDKRGPRLNAVIEVNPDARVLASQLDRERKAGHIRGPLHGIPILIKDNIETGDRMRTTAGSLALGNWSAQEDAPLVARLRAAGAVILGKTNLSEWANFRSTHSISGWSGRGGQTRNPYALDHNPSGSSSGSGASTAASLCAAAVGTETDGSVTSPSSINGLAGLKPTVGLVSRDGIVPISASQDTAGPMARSVRDLAILLGAMADNPHDYTRYLDPRGLRGARLGVARRFFENNAPLDRFLSTCVDALKKAGAEVIDPADLPTHGQFDAAENEVLQYEFKDGLNRYLTRLPAGSPARTLRELIAYNEKYREREMPFFDQEIFIQSEARGPLTEAKYVKARADCVRLSRAEGIDAVLAQHKLDAIVSLTSGPAWYTDSINGDRDTGGCTTPAAVAGYPHITVPAGYYRGLPIGLSFFSTAWAEPNLIKLAYAWEQQMNARRKPGYAAQASA